jgi:hypothetical protein
MIININNKKILFIHIPKTGGSTVEYAFLEKMNREIYWPNYYEDLLWGYNNNLHYQHLTMDQIFNKLKLYKLSDFDFIFTIVRNPLNKFISECNWSNINSDKTINLFKTSTFCHYLLQYDYIKYFEKNIKIYKYEDGLQNIINDVIKINNLNIKIILKKHVSSVKKYNINNLTEENIENIKKIFKKDYIYFKYNINSFI